MKKLLFFLLITIFNLKAEVYKKDEKIIHSKNEIPGELKLIIASYQKADISNEKFQLFLRHIYNIDSYINFISKEEFYFMSKSEIYKTILKNLTPTHQNFEISNLPNFKKAAEKSKDPFIKWLINSFYSDAQEMVSTKAYKDYLAEKLMGEITSPASKKIQKKLQLISRFYSKLSFDYPDSIRIDLLKSYEECFTNIEATMFILMTESKFEKYIGPPSIGDPLTHFTLDNFKKRIQEPDKKLQKSIEEILEESPETLDEEEQSAKALRSNNLPSPSKEDWLKEDSNTIDLKKIPKATDDAEWLEDF